MALGISFRDDFVSSVSSVGDASRRYEDDQYEDEMNQLRLASARRSDASGRRTEEDAVSQRSVFKDARAQLESRDPDGTPLGSAFRYAYQMADIVTLTKAGDLETAYAKFDKLDKQANKYREHDITVASTRPGNDFEKSIQAGAQQRAQKTYLSQEVSLPDGTTTTIGELYRDGESYKKYSYDTVMRSSFSKDVADSYKSDDPFRAAVFREIVDPVVKDPKRKVGGSHEYKTQFYDVAEYVHRDFDDMRSELGDKGFHRLVMDVVEKRMSKGVAIETMDRVRSYVAAQRQASPDADPMELVRKSIGQFDRMCKNLSENGQEPTDDMVRYASKIMTAVTKNSPGPVDFDDDRTRAAMDSAARLVADYDRFGIKLLPMLDEAGTGVSKAFAEYVDSATRGQLQESNVLTRLDNVLRYTVGAFSAGATQVQQSPRKRTDPRVGRYDPSTMLGYTTGSNSMDLAVTRMVSSLNRKYLVPMVAGGMREDLALPAVVEEHGADLVTDWTRVLATFTGITETAAAACAEAMVGRMTSGNGGLTQIDPVRIMQVLAFSDDFAKTNPSDARSLRRWFKSEGLAGKALEAGKESLMSILMDPDIGMGLRQDQATAVMNSYSQLAVGMMEKGDNGPGWLELKAKQGNVLRPTGKFTVPGVVDEKTGNAKAMTRAELDVLARKSSNPQEFWKRVIPQVQVYVGDLDGLEYDGITTPGGVMVPPVARNSFTSNRVSLAASQRQLKALVRHSAEREKAVEKAPSDDDE